MVENLPIWIEVLFIICFLFTILQFYYSNGKPNSLMVFLLIWSLAHSILAFVGFYQITDTLPPRFGFVLIPVIALIIYGCLPKQRQWVIKNRNVERSTFLHTVRIPVEIILYYLFLDQMIPELMTFEGRNYDIIAGLTAPVIGVLLMKKKISKKGLILWNVFGLFLILFIFINALLSAELPFQQFAFDQPNRAISYFPFILLASTVVPIVIYTHITDIIKLSSKTVQ